MDNVQSKSQCDWTADDEAFIKRHERIQARALRVVEAMQGGPPVVGAPEAIFRGDEERIARRMPEIARAVVERMVGVSRDTSPDEFRQIRVAYSKLRQMVEVYCVGKYDDLEVRQAIDLRMRTLVWGTPAWRTYDAERARRRLLVPKNAARRKLQDRDRHSSPEAQEARRERNADPAHRTAEAARKRRARASTKVRQTFETLEALLKNEPGNTTEIARLRRELVATAMAFLTQHEGLAEDRARDEALKLLERAAAGEVAS